MLVRVCTCLATASRRICQSTRALTTTNRNNRFTHSSTNAENNEKISKQNNATNESNINTKDSISRSGLLTSINKLAELKSTEQRWYQLQQVIGITPFQTDHSKSPPEQFVDDDRHYTLTPTHPRFLPLYPSLSIRLYRPSPFAVPFYDTQNVPKSNEVMQWEQSLPPRNQLHCILLHSTHSDRWTYSSIHRALMKQPELIADDQFLYDWSLRRKGSLRARHRRFNAVLLRIYEEEFGADAVRSIKHALRDRSLFEHLSALMVESHTLSKREDTVKATMSGSNGADQNNMLEFIGHKHHTLKIAIFRALYRLGYDTANAQMLISCQLNDPDFQVRTEAVVNILNDFEFWCVGTVANAYEEQSQWVEPPHAYRNKTNCTLATPVLTRVYYREKRVPPRTRTEGLGSGTPKWRLYAIEAQQELEERKHNPELQNAPPSFAVVLSQYFDVKSKRFMFEYWRHRISLSEIHRRATEDGIVMDPSKFRMRQQQRHWFFRKFEKSIWLQVLEEELQHNASIQSLLSEILMNWQSMIAGRRPELHEILQLLQSCLPLLTIREPLSSLSTLEQFGPPTPDASDTLYSSSMPYQQTPFSLPYSQHHSHTANATLMRLFHDPQSNHKMSIALINSRADHAIQIARVIHSAYTQCSSEEEISSNWLELRPDESSDNIEVDASTLDTGANAVEVEAVQLLDMLRQQKVEPTSLPQFVQEGWLMTDLGEVMVLSCSDNSSLNTWISHEKQITTEVNEQQFVHLVDTASPTLNQCNILLKSNHSTQLALHHEKRKQ